MIKEPVEKRRNLLIKHKIHVAYEPIDAPAFMFSPESQLPLLFLFNPRSLPLLSNPSLTPQLELASYVNCPYEYGIQETI